MLDYLIRGGLLVDGTGSAARQADVGIRGDRIVVNEPGEEPSKVVLEADGLVVAPGFVDPHTHYDAQLQWDGRGTPSSDHGVTTVIGGNCGFTLAPLRARDADYTRRMMAKVEGMPLDALESGIEWKWESFGEYLDSLEGKIAMNAGFLVGHCALRRYVMGEAAIERSATEDEEARIAALLDESLSAGGLGLSTTRSSTHADDLNRPVPSRQASEAEVLRLCELTAGHPGTTLEAIIEGCLKYFEPEEVQLLARMSAVANRPINWNVLMVKATEVDRIEHQLEPSHRAREIGGRVVALTMPVIADNNMSFGSFCALWLIPGWHDVLSAPRARKTAMLRDPAVRRRLEASAEGSPFANYARIANFQVGETVAPENRRWEGELISDIARQRGVEPWDALIDIEVADDYQTMLWPTSMADAPEDWELRRKLWELDDVLVGGSDAGAHLDRMLGSSYPTRFVADAIRGRKLVSLERAVELMTRVPARLFGLTGRGEVTDGALADLVVFDPETIDSDRAHRAYDLPGGNMRLTAASRGIEHVWVNGVPTISAGMPSDARPGTVLRSGRDTATVTTR